MPNPKPVSYKMAIHKPDCQCRPCKGRRGENKGQKTFKLRKDILELLASLSEKTGKHQNQIIEEAITNYVKEDYNQ